MSTPKLKQKAFFGDKGSFVITLAINAGAPTAPLSTQPSARPVVGVVHAKAGPAAETVSPAW
ncbi:MAG: hypothetical protein BWY59_01175 [Verrucomicrobia bacterium ADurb.Bin345]|nr:MAG: hypothetical protein BWY59_01175 [Verrucomicrobia bacterium ADurb.Bin345]